MRSDLLDFGPVGESEKVGFPGIWRWGAPGYFLISTGGCLAPLEELSWRPEDFNLRSGLPLEVLGTFWGSKTHCHSWAPVPLPGGLNLVEEG